MAGSPSSSRSGALQLARVHVTSAQILAIGDGTPATLIAAPSTNTVLNPRYVVFIYRPGTVAYDRDPGMIVTWTGFTGTSVGSNPDSLIQATAQVYSAHGPDLGFELGAASPAETPQGQALVLSGTSLQPFTPPLGNGTMDVAVYFTADSLLAA
jgi:hypothetical protein